MQINLQNILNRGEKIAVAVSGGRDSMALLHYLFNNSNFYGIEVLAVNVEHGIRGKSSISDTEFVKNYCKDNGIKLLTYSVDAVKKAKEEKLSIEQSARILRYQCFEKAISSGECDKVATAHHRDDNVETVLFNVFRGTGLKGLSGIIKERQDNIIRPFLSVDQTDIVDYVDKNKIPFVTDQTNFSDEYSRNYIRHNVLPQIKKLFPELNQSVERLALIAKQDDEYITNVAKDYVIQSSGQVILPLPCHPAVLSRAVIIAFKALGITKDWEKAHIDDVINLASLKTGAKLSLLKGITAIKEYDKIVLYREQENAYLECKFEVGKVSFLDKTIKTKLVDLNQINLKDGLFADLDKIPSSAIFRTRKDGDVFKKFSGGTKALGDYFTDIKLPLRQRDSQVLLANGNQVLVILGIAISDLVKVERQSSRVISFDVD